MQQNTISFGLFGWELTEVIVALDAGLDTTTTRTAVSAYYTWKHPGQ